MAAAVLLAGPAPQPPPGIPADRYRRALAEDTYEVLHALASVTAGLAATGPALARLARDLAWPGAPLVELAEDDPAPLPSALAALAEATGADHLAVVAADAPDLPPLHAGKLLGALEDVPVGVAPAAGGGLVGLAARLPLPAWLPPDLDDPEALDRLHAAAPVRSVVVCAGWHRLRRAPDVAGLDPGLEGWEATRALLTRGGASPTR